MNLNSLNRHFRSNLLKFFQKIRQVITRRRSFSFFFYYIGYKTLQSNKIISFSSLNFYFEEVEKLITSFTKNIYMQWLLLFSID